jgi:hypothetical protein
MHATLSRESPVAPPHQIICAKRNLRCRGTFCVDGLRQPFRLRHMDRGTTMKNCLLIAVVVSLAAVLCSVVPSGAARAADKKPKVLVLPGGGPAEPLTAHPRAEVTIEWLAGEMNAVPTEKVRSHARSSSSDAAQANGTSAAPAKSVAVARHARPKVAAAERTQRAGQPPQRPVAVEACAGSKLPMAQCLDAVARMNRFVEQAPAVHTVTRPADTDDICAKTHATKARCAELIAKMSEWARNAGPAAPPAASAEKLPDLTGTPAWSVTANAVRPTGVSAARANR